MFTYIYNYIKSIFYTCLPVEKSINKKVDDKCSCGNPISKEPTEIIVLNHKMKIGSLIYCSICCEKRLNDECGICSTCKEPILPGEPFGGSVNDDGVVHYTMDCSFPGSYVGCWSKENKK